MFENYLYSENPPIFERSAWYGLIFRWYGVDRIGNIAIFETGELPIPKRVFDDEKEYKEVDLFFRQLPQISSARVVTELQKKKTAAGTPVDYNYWISEASRGLFFFDEIDYLETRYIYGYYLITIPEIQMSFNALPSKIQELLEPYRFPIIFSETKEFDARNYFICE